MLLGAVRSLAAKQIMQETGLIPCGSGAQAMNQIKVLFLAFDCRHELDVDGARKLLVLAVEKFQMIVNNDERIRPYLSNYPFESKNIEISIYIQESDGSDFGNGKLVVVSAHRGLLKYNIYTPNKFGLITIHEESFEEAQKKLSEAREAA